MFDVVCAVCGSVTVSFMSCESCRSVVTVFGSVMLVMSYQPGSRLVLQYKLLYKPMAKVIGKGDFRPSTAAKPLNRF